MQRARRNLSKYKCKTQTDSNVISIKTSARRQSFALRQLKFQIPSPKVSTEIQIRILLTYIFDDAAMCVRRRAVWGEIIYFFSVSQKIFHLRSDFIFIFYIRIRNVHTIWCDYERTLVRRKMWILKSLFCWFVKLAERRVFGYLFLSQPRRWMQMWEMLIFMIIEWRFPLHRLRRSRIFINLIHFQ